MYNIYKGKDEILSALADGLIVPFALATALYSAGSLPVEISCWAIIAGIAGGFFMAIAGYYSAKSTKNPEAEIKKLLNIFENIGLDKAYQQQAVQDIQREYALLPVDNSITISPSKNAYYTFIAYLCGSLLTSLPYFFISNHHHAFTVSAIASAILLILTGYLSNTKQAVFGILRNLFFAILTGAAAYFVAKLF